MYAPRTFSVKDFVRPMQTGTMDFRTFGVQNTGMRKPRAKRKFSKHYLREYRLRAGLTAKELGGRVGLSHASILRIEALEQQITQRVLDDLARALQTSRGAILDYPPKDDPKR